MLCVYLPLNRRHGEANVTLWRRRVALALAHATQLHGYNSKLAAQQDVCLFAQQNWNKHFTKVFLVNTSVAEVEICQLGFNAQGLLLMNKAEHVERGIAYADIASVATTANNDKVLLRLGDGEELSLRCAESVELAQVINYMLGHDTRGVHFVSNAVSTSVALSNSDSNSSVAIKRAHKKSRARVTWSTGNASIAARNNKKAHKPIRKAEAAERLLQPHTLQHYAEEYFRTRTDSSEPDLWRYSPAPLRAPLLLSSQKTSEVFQNALVIAHHMLKYMNNIPTNTDLIFRAAIEYESLRDELYCQLMRQLTANDDEARAERAWELMYLASGVVTPSAMLTKELSTFLNTRTHPLSSVCQARLQNIAKTGARKRPPCILEVESIQQRRMCVEHKIYFPNGAIEAFDVQSFTRAADLCAAIKTKIGLACMEGYAIFISLDNKLLAVADEEYLYDAITAALQQHQLHTLKRTTERMLNQCNYQLHFRKKLWLATTPSADRIANEMFHYPQAVANYLNGYFDISEHKAQQLGSLVYVSVYGNTTAALFKVHNILEQLLPTDLLPQKQHNEWKAALKAEVQQLQLSAVDQLAAKQQFLRKLAGVPNFGSTFFVVKQMCDENLPKLLLLAVNKEGLTVLDVDTKRTLQRISYSDIASWTCESNAVQLHQHSVPTALQLCTAQVQELTDLLTDYYANFNTQH